MSHEDLLESAINMYLLVCHLNTFKKALLQSLLADPKLQQALSAESVFLLAALPNPPRLWASLGNEGKSTEYRVTFFSC